MTRRTTDLFLAGPIGLSSTVNNILNSAGTAIDTMAAGAGLPNYRSFYVQVAASSGISAGAIVFEGSNDNTNFTQLWSVDAGASSGFVTAAGITIAASTNRFFEGPIKFRYFRARISTAFSGGTISATARLSTEPYTNAVMQVSQSSAANLNATVIPVPAGSGGFSIFTGAVVAAAQSVKSGAGQVYGYDIHNPNAAISYVSFYDIASGSVTVGTSTQKWVVGIPANSRASGEIPMGAAHGTAIAVAATTTRGGNTAPGTAVDVNVFYK